MRKYEVYKVTLKPHEAEWLKKYRQDFATVEYIGEFEAPSQKKAVDAMANSENFAGFDSGDFFFAKTSSSIAVNRRLKLPNELHFAYCVGRKLYQPKKKKCQ